MKKMRSELYGVHFILETDAKVLVEQLNGAASDLPGALLTNWIAWMRLMDFEVKHIPGNKNTAADGLSRRGREHPSDIVEQREQDIDEWIATELGAITVFGTSTKRLMSPDHNSQERILNDTYSNDSEEIARFLINLKRLVTVKLSNFKHFKNKAL
jgi:hypothetical protein